MYTIRIVVPLVLSLLLWGCSSSSGGASAVADAGITDVVEPDASDTRPIQLSDISGAELDSTPSETLVTLTDGAQLPGQLIAVYDQRRWWESAERTTVALWNEAAYRPDFDDRSVRLLDLADFAKPRPPLPAQTPPGYIAFTRQQGLLIRRSPLEGVAFVITGNESYHLDENGYGDFAWDLVRTDELGNRFRDFGTQNSDYLVWENPVYLPTAGTVIEVVRDGPDNALPGSYPDGATNNLVGIQLGGQYYLYLLHFRQFSIPSPEDQSCEPHVEGVVCIVPGAKLPAGTYLGRVGNSGVTLEPHLHMTMLWFDADATPPRSWSLPTEWTQLYSSYDLEMPAKQLPYSVPLSGQWISSEPF